MKKQTKKQKKNEIIYYNKNKLSFKVNDQYQVFEKEELLPFYQKIQQEIQKKDAIRRLCTKLIFAILCIGAIIYGIFGRPNGDFWFFLFFIQVFKLIGILKILKVL